MGLKVRYNGTIVDFSDAKYEPGNLGTKRLKIRTGTGANAIKQYGLATSAANSSDRRLRFNVDGQVHYIGTSATSTSQSNYTTYSSYYTYTYTQTYTNTYGQSYTQSYTQTASQTYRQTYPRSSVLTRQGTQTTATRTQPARYTYRASYYNGVASGYTVSTRIKWDVQTAYLSGTRSSGYNTTRTASRSSGYTQHYSYQWRGNVSKYSYSARASATSALFKNYGLKTTYTYSGWDMGAEFWTAQGTYTQNWNVGDFNISGTRFYTTTANVVYAQAGKTSVTWQGKYSESRSQSAVYTVQGKTAITASRSSQYNSDYSTTRSSGYSSVAPNYVWLGASQAGNWQPWVDVAVGAAAYKASYLTDYYSEAHVANQSYRRVTRHRTTALKSSSTQRTGAATLTSTATPIGGVPSNYTLSSGPLSIASAASYTYTDAGCTRTYASNYSTSYWTVTSTLTRTNTNTHTRTLTNTLTQTNTGTYNSTPWYSSSQGSTATTRASIYTAHNFV